MFAWWRPPTGTSKEVVAGRFREDLFHRLNVVRLTLPPLRERKEDIPLLIERFLADAPGRFLISHDALEAMQDYNWPGNIRELKNCLERMMAFNSGPLLHFADLPTSVARTARAPEPGAPTGFAAAAVAGRRGDGPFAAIARGQCWHRARWCRCRNWRAGPSSTRCEHTRGDRTTAAPSCWVSGAHPLPQAQGIPIECEASAVSLPANSKPPPVVVSLGTRACGSHSMQHTVWATGFRAWASIRGRLLNGLAASDVAESWDWFYRSQRYFRARPCRNLRT